jgi:hypothetical protein
MRNISAARQLRMSMTVQRTEQHHARQDNDDEVVGEKTLSLNAGALRNALPFGICGRNYQYGFS